MPFQKGDKFTIEITDVMTGEDGQTVYRMNDFASLVFDDYGLQRLTRQQSERPNPFARDGHYYTICTDGTVECSSDLDDSMDNARFGVANYCTDKAMMEQRALHEILNRLLWRYSEEHGGDTEWDDVRNHYYIGYCDDELGVFGNQFCRSFADVYFKDRNTAEEALNQIVKPFMYTHPEFIW